MRSVPLYPFFAAVYPVLAAAAENTHLGVTISDLWFPIAFTLSAAGLVLLATGTIYKDPVKRALVTTFIIGFLFWYGYLFAGFRNIGLPPSGVLHEWVFPLGLAITVVGVAFVTRTASLPHQVTRFLNLAFGILLLFPALGFARQSLVEGVEHEGEHLAILEDSLFSHATAKLPDIYFIVLDAYTGSRTLDAIYGFDNSDFESELRERAFVVRSSQRSNYVITFLSLASILNWDYIHRIVRLNPRSQEQLTVYKFIENNRSVHALKRMGYTFVFFPTSFPMSNENRFADLQLGQTPGCCNLFVGAWLSTTAFFPVNLWMERWTAAAGVPRIPFRPEPAENILLKFDQLKSLPDLEGPLFVLAHLILPHEPYQFHADCSVRRPVYWPLEITSREEERVRSAYIEQLKCTNALVLRLVDSLLERSDRSPVILLQSDHGYGRFDLGQPLSLDSSTPDQVEERIDAFAAYHLPGVDPDAVPGEFTAVNLFRLVFREYFGATLPFVEDATYWSAFELPYDLTRLTTSRNSDPGIAPDSAPVSNLKNQR